MVIISFSYKLVTACVYWPMIDCLHRMSKENTGYLQAYLIIANLKQTAIIMRHPEQEPTEASPDHDQDRRPPARSRRHHRQ